MSVKNHGPHIFWIVWGYRGYFIIRNSIFFCFSCGPIFGAGADLLISNNCDMNKDSYSNLPHSYDGENASTSVLMSDYSFTVVDYEVFTLVSK